MKWRQIETAPKDGRLLLLLSDCGTYYIGSWNLDKKCWWEPSGYGIGDNNFVYYWMPLPEPPKKD